MGYRRGEEAVARQIRFLGEQGLTGAAALEKVRGVAGADQQAWIDNIEEMLRSPEARLGDDHLLGRFVRRARAASGDPGMALTAMTRLAEDMSAVARDLYQSFKFKIRYVCAIAAVGFFLSQSWVLFVWPSFESMYRDFGAPLPSFANTALSLGFFGFPLAFLIVFVLAVFALVRVRSQADGIRNLRPWNFDMMSRNLRAAGNIRLTTALTGVFRDAGVSDEDSLGMAADMLANAAPPSLGSELDLALGTGTLQQELDYQVDRSNGEIARLSKRQGDWEVLALKYVLFVLIALAIVSFYEPIFGLAAGISE